jgi:hypothetical protein
VYDISSDAERTVGRLAGAAGIEGWAEDEGCELCVIGWSSLGSRIVLLSCGRSEALPDEV